MTILRDKENLSFHCNPRATKLMETVTLVQTFKILKKTSSRTISKCHATMPIMQFWKSTALHCHHLDICYIFLRNRITGSWEHKSVNTKVFLPLCILCAFSGNLLGCLVPFKGQRFYLCRDQELEDWVDIAFTPNSVAARSLFDLTCQ